MPDPVYDDLGPVGKGDPAKLVEFAHAIGLESSEARRLHIGGANVHAQAELLDRAQTRYLYGNESGADDGTLNYIQGTVNTFSAMAFRTPPVMHLLSKSTGDEGKWVLIKPWSIPPETDAMGQVLVDPVTLQPHQPIPLALYEEIDEAVLEHVPDDHKVLIDVAAVVERQQKIFDFKRDESRLDARLRMIPHRQQLHGWPMGLIQWDEQAQKPIVMMHEPQQWFPDPVKEAVEDMNYVRLDVPTDVLEAKRMHPELSAWIDENASRSITYEAPAAPYSSIYHLTFQRPMVTMCYVWLRNQPAPMTLDEVVEYGLADWQEVPNVQGAANAGLGGGAGTVAESAENNPVGAQDGAAATPAPQAAMPSDNPANQIPAPAPSRRLVHTRHKADLTDSFKEDGSPAEKLHASHPMKRVIRQYVITNGKLAPGSDMICPWPDIPVFLARNNPITGRPFAQGDTERLRAPHQSINDLNKAQVKHAARFRGPTGIVAKSVVDNMKPGFQDGHAEPDKMYVYDDSQTPLSALKDNMMMLDPPQMPPALPLVERQMLDHYQTIAGNPGVNQGAPPPGVTSGVAIGALQSVSQAPQALKSMSLEEAIERIVMMTNHAMVFWLTDEEWYRIDRSLPLPVVKKFVRPLARQIAWGCDVQLMTGAGQVRLQEQQQARQDAGVTCADGKPLTTAKNVREAIGLDHAKIEEELKADQEERAQQQMELPQPAAPPPNAPKPTKVMPGQPRLAVGGA